MRLTLPYADDVKHDLRKPAKGSGWIERRRHRHAGVEHERAEKLHVRDRDRHLCRWPRCGCKALKTRTEVAHILDKSLGGSDDRENLILLCVTRHQGAWSLHSKDCKIVPHDKALGAEGPCDFLERTEAGQWEIVASERYVGVSETRRAS